MTSFPCFKHNTPETPETLYLAGKSVHFGVGDPHGGLDGAGQPRPNHRVCNRRELGIEVILRLLARLTDAKAGCE